MGYILNYLLEISICLGVLYLFYIAVLHDQSSYHCNRVYLLAAMVAGIAIPLLEIPIYVQSADNGNNAFIMLYPMMATGAGSQGAFQWQWEYSLWLVYGLGALTAGIYYFRQCLSVFWTIRTGKTQPSPRRGYKLVHTEGKFPTSSFFHYLLWDNTQSLSVREIHQMMAHEETHIRQRHSYDIAYITLLKILFWFHPLIYLYEKALVDNHEFAADAGALMHPTGDRRTYFRLLARQSMARLQWSVVNHFYKSKTLKRITMMEKKYKILWYRYLLVVPVLASLFLVFSCQPDTEEMEQEAIAQSYDEVQAQIEEVGGQLDALVKKYFDNQGYFIDAVSQEREKLDNPSSGSFQELQLTVFKNVASGTDYRNFESLIHQQETFQQKLMSLPDAAGVYTVVEDQPEPAEGMASFYEYVMTNLKYPLQARRMGIEGKVFVQFVVDEHGEISEVKAIKGIGAGCDAEAERVLKEAVSWNPGLTDGKPVKVRLVLPITFKLDHDSEEESADKSLSVWKPEDTSKKMDEITVIAYVTAS